MLGCEYKLHDNYIIIEKPVAENIGINIYLDVESDGKTIYMYEKNNIQFNLETSGYEVYSCIFRLDNMLDDTKGSTQWGFNKSSGNFYVSGSLYTEGHYTLTCDVYVKSGNGSLSDHLEAELFYGTFQWPVEFYVEPKSGIFHRINEEGFLELSWKKPFMMESGFICYKVYYNDIECVVITDPDQTSFVCESYFGESAKFNVIAETKVNKNWSMGSVYLIEQKIEIIADYSDDENIILKWNNPYKSAVCVIEYSNNDTLVSYSKDETARITYGLFGTRGKEFSFSFSPYNEKDRWHGRNITTYENIHLSRGIFTAPKGNWPRFGYNVTENVLYVSSFGEITSWLLPKCEKHIEYIGNNWNNVNTYTSSLYDSKMAVVYGGKIDILDGKGMKSVKTISYPSDPLSFTEDGKLICFTYDNGYKGLVYNIAGEMYDFPYLLFDIPVTTFAGPKISYDSRYLVIYESSSNIIVMTIDDFKVVKKDNLNVVSSGYCFNPLIPEELYISTNNNILIYNVKNLSLIDALNYPDMSIGNIDPKTGYMLLYNNDSIKIIDTKTKLILYSMPVDSGFGFWLYGNTLISADGYALNLDKYIAK